MEMLLTLLALSGLLTMLSVFCLRAALTFDASRPEAQPESEKKLALDSRFFAGDVTGVPSAPIPRDVLLMQIEHHVRIEKAVAEHYLELPTREALHSPTSSLFVN
jgi:hypothetical protein